MPDLGDDEQLVSGDNPFVDGLLNSFTNSFLVFVETSSVNVPVSVFNCIVEDLRSFDTRSAESHGWHIVSGVQLNHIYF